MPENYLMHFGNKNSGRYRRGSGEHPHQHDGLGNKRDWLTRTDEQGKGHYAKKGAAVGAVVGVAEGALKGAIKTHDIVKSSSMNKGLAYTVGILTGAATYSLADATLGAMAGSGLNITNRIFGRKGK